MIICRSETDTIPGYELSREQGQEREERGQPSQSYHKELLKKIY
jgi:hypothetical protein